MQAHVLDEFVEQISRIVRAGAGFGMILHREHRQPFVAQAFEAAVVEIEMCEFDFVGVEAGGVYGKAVIVRSDFDLVKAEVARKKIHKAK